MKGSGVIVEKYRFNIFTRQKTVQATDSRVIQTAYNRAAKD